jgi:hypothetical protein
MSKTDKTGAAAWHITLPSGENFDMCLERLGLAPDSPLSAIAAGVWAGSQESWDKWSKFVLNTYAPGEPVGKTTNNKIKAMVLAADVVPVYDFEKDSIVMIRNPMKPPPKQAYNLHRENQKKAKKRKA